MAWFVFVLAVVAATSLWWGPLLAGGNGEDRVRRAAAAMERVEREMVRQFRTMQRETGHSVSHARLQSMRMALRCQIELYRTEHEGAFPGILSDGSFDGKLMARQLTSRTNEKGDIAPTRLATTEYPFGPYMPCVSPNPFVQGPRASQIAGGAGGPPRDGSTGWWFDTDTGRVYANHSAAAFTEPTPPWPARRRLAPRP
jgi:hypothetical protein